MTIDRSKRPAVQQITNIQYTLPSVNKLAGGSNFFTIKGEEQEVVKLDFTTKAGSWYQQHKLVGVMAAGMLTEGNISMKAEEIADRIDFYGAQLHASSMYDNSYLSLLTLKRHLPKLLPLVADMLKNSVIPQNEFEILRQQRKQQAQVDAERVGLIAQRRFLQEIFGSQHPYAPVNSPDAFDDLTREAVLDHYNNFYGSARMNIYGSGDIDQQVENMVTHHFGDSWGAAMQAANHPLTHRNSTDTSIFIEKPGANQNAMTIGKRFPTQKDADSIGLKILTTVLGGYFGSRLMTNLREEKGLTYSIHSSYISFINDAVFLIHAEVAADKSDEAVRETFAEINKLREEPVPESELHPLRNYLLGRMLEEFDGPFARAQSFTALHEAGLSYHYYDQMIEAIQTITPQRIMELAQTYLDPQSMLTVVAGIGKS